MFVTVYHIHLLLLKPLLSLKALKRFVQSAVVEIVQLLQIVYSAVKVIVSK